MIITIPSDLCVQRVEWGSRRFDISSSFSDTGARQSKRLAPTRWTASIIAPDKMARGEAAVFSALIESLDGKLNRLAVYDMQYPLIRGTARGAWQLAETAQRWAKSFRVYAGPTQAGKTVLRGDLIGVLQTSDVRQLLHVRQDSTFDADGFATIVFDHALRTALVPGEVVIYDRPTGLFEQDTTASGWSGTGVLRGGHSLSLIEVFKA